MKPSVVVRGGGDIASGTIYRLWKAGYPVVVTEIAIPTMIRREVSYGNAVHRGEMIVERQTSRFVSLSEVQTTLEAGIIPVVTESYDKVLEAVKPIIVVDAILAKRNLGTTAEDAPLVIGLGPGFTAGENVDVVIETMRGHTLGRCIYEGSALPNTGIPGEIGGHSALRVMHAPTEGLFTAKCHIGDTVGANEIIGYVEDIPIRTPIDGILRGILMNGLMVHKGLKLADVDPRCEEGHCFTISDKALAIAGGVLEAILTWEHKRSAVE